MPELGNVAAEVRAQLEEAIGSARPAIEKHQAWLENELLPKASGNFPTGAKFFDRKPAYTLNSLESGDAQKKEGGSTRSRPSLLLKPALFEVDIHPEAEVTTAPAVQFPGRVEAIYEVGGRRVEFRFSVKHVHHV